MAFEVYKLTVQMGVRQDLGIDRTYNVFHWLLDNQASLTPYAAALDLSASLQGFFSWVSNWRSLFVLANEVYEWKIGRVWPDTGPVFNGSIQMRAVTGTRILVLGADYLTTVIHWIVDDDKPRLPHNEIGFTTKSDWDDDTIWPAYHGLVNAFCDRHLETLHTPQGNHAAPCARRSSGDFPLLVNYWVDEQPGRRITRRRPH